MNKVLWIPNVWFMFRTRCLADSGSTQTQVLRVWRSLMRAAALDTGTRAQSTAAGAGRPRRCVGAGRPSQTPRPPARKAELPAQSSPAHGCVRCRKQTHEWYRWRWKKWVSLQPYKFITIAVVWTWGLGKFTDTTSTQLGCRPLRELHQGCFWGEFPKIAR